MNDKIYLAGSCSKDRRNLMEHIADLLRYRDFKVYCPFELKITNAWSYSQEEWAKQVFEKDVKAIKQCDIFLMISEGRSSSAGTNWEQGYAYGLGKTVIVIQYTDADTSLMTFSGCTIFKNTTKNELDDTIIQAINESYMSYRDSNTCSTTLT